jgi:hypothetical protein
MRPLRRRSGALVLAITIAMGLAMTTPTAASTNADDATIDRFCSALGETIEFLEQRPPSRLRDALLEGARRLFARYCE